MNKQLLNTSNGSSILVEYWLYKINICKKYNIAIAEIFVFYRKYRQCNDEIFLDTIGAILRKYKHSSILRQYKYTSILAQY